MKRTLSTLVLAFLLVLAPGKFYAQDDNPVAADTGQTSQIAESASEMHAGEPEVEEHHDLPELWSVVPFVLLLLMIATGPLFYKHFWHKNYPLVAMVLGSLVVLYYLFVLHDTHAPLHSLQEYVSFITLLTALFVASGGILIKVDKAGTPLVNIGLLVIGAVVANIIGTTGASMLLIRPFIRLNKNRIKPYHVVFFIFMVSNVGGCLTPIGDPPLFLGFLKGVPFFWTLTHSWPMWITGIAILSLMFYFVDKRNHAHYYDPEEKTNYSGKVTVKGAKNVIFLAITIAAVFLDPNVLDWVPSLHLAGMEFSFLREGIMLITAFVAYKASSEECLKGNEFEFEPIREVAFLFVGIFATMMPALQLISAFAGSPDGSALISINSLYWATGALSGVLDNAPTYLNFLSAGMGKAGLHISEKTEVLNFVRNNSIDLLAISVSSVFFGAMTYIGNAPNFMVKSIAEQVGIQMPSFVSYVVKYSIPILLPMLFLIWLMYFMFAG